MFHGRSDHLARVKSIVLEALAPYRATVCLFGSRARGDAGVSSDIDVAVDPRGPLPAGVLARLREALEESTIPQQIDVIDMRDVDAEFRERIRQEGVVWTDCRTPGYRRPRASDARGTSGFG